LRITNFISFIKLGVIHPDLMLLAWRLKRTKRTYLSFPTLYSLSRNFLLVKNRHPRPLQIAEFGVGRGGSATILAWLVNRYKGKLTLYDVFSRIPAPTEKDGERALNRYDYIMNQESKDYYGNIPNLLDVVLNDLHEVCHPDRIEIIQGKYEDTLANIKDAREFSLVHIDCDWYESSMCVYSYLHERIQPGAIIQVDDFSNWDGSKRAFQDANWLHQYQTWIVDGALVIDTSKNKTR
jgi:predicted O-methyltransferase YrrM